MRWTTSPLGVISLTKKSVYLIIKSVQRRRKYFHVPMLLPVGMERGVGGINLAITVKANRPASRVSKIGLQALSNSRRMNH